MSKYIYKNCLRKIEGKGAMLKRFLFAILSIFLVISIASSASAISDSKTEKILFININYKDSEITVNEMAYGRGFVPNFEESSFRDAFKKAEIRLLDEDKEIIYSSYFFIENMRFQDFVDESTGEMSGGIVELNDINFTIITPYPNNLDSIEIYSDYNKISLKNVKVVNEKKVAAFEPDNKEKVGKKSEDKTLEDDKEKKSLFLEFIGIFDDFYKYVFGGSK